MDQPAANDCAIRSHTQIAEMFGLTRSRIWQIEQRALKKLRTAILADPVLSAIVREEGIHHDDKDAAA